MVHKLQTIDLVHFNVCYKEKAFKHLFYFLWYRLCYGAVYAVFFSGWLQISIKIIQIINFSVFAFQNSLIAILLDFVFMGTLGVEEKK